MMQEVEVLKTIQELICSFFSEEQFTLSSWVICVYKGRVSLYNKHISWLSEKIKRGGVYEDKD